MMSNETIIKIKDAVIEQIIYSDSWDEKRAIEIGTVVLGEEYLKGLKNDE